MDEKEFEQWIKEFDEWLLKITEESDKLGKSIDTVLNRESYNNIVFYEVF